MATSKAFFEYVMEQLSGLEGVRCRAMMGEYILYYNDRIIGGIYDNQLLLKITDVSRSCMPDAPEAPPYPGAKPMLLVENPENRNFLYELFRTMYPELPAPKAKKKRNS